MYLARARATGIIPLGSRSFRLPRTMITPGGRTAAVRIYYPASCFSRPTPPPPHRANNYDIYGLIRFIAFTVIRVNLILVSSLPSTHPPGHRSQYKTVCSIFCNIFKNYYICSIYREDEFNLFTYDIFVYELCDNMNDIKNKSQFCFYIIT